MPEGFDPEADPVCWIRNGSGLVGWGEAARIETGGADRFLEADERWRRLVANMEVDDEVGLPGTGPVAFTSIAFSDHPGDSTLVVPEVIVGRRGGVRWITTVGDGRPDLRPAPSPTAPGEVRYEDGDFPATRYRRAVAEAVRRMRDGAEVDKVVLAHDLLATTPEPLRTRYLLDNLSLRYPDCWTFAVDGLVGATPELLLRRAGDEVNSRVLAGTAWPRPGSTQRQLVTELVDSAKNRGEHTHAVRSLARELEPFCKELEVPTTPEVLRLRNVLHLASDVAGRLDPTLAENGQAGLLRLSRAVHPTAAVGGSPTGRAIELIDELEEMDRGRYSGPVGWQDADGNGEFGIALRCARLGEDDGGGSRARLFAGCGVVADSDPDTEVAEAAAKLLPVREALEGMR
ncbi:isochorismate synthase [Actinopolyspora mortivallis]|uniref:isochorismate synthase n=1 Tax=Actinopolyspora mortivallis TaxID=33906 RepID=A0A2T0GXR4_ACTMO|nr:isochorismate synthase [Actinopolyspora mortivallis]